MSANSAGAVSFAVSEMNLREEAIVISLKTLFETVTGDLAASVQLNGNDGVPASVRSLYCCLPVAVSFSVWITTRCARASWASASEGLSSR